MEDKEIWKPVTGYEGLYEVSSFGNVKSIERYKKHSKGGLQRINERVLKMSNRNGYSYVNLYINNISKKKYVHLLVSTAFLNVSIDCCQVNHKDGCKTNNNISNLEYVNPYENMSHVFIGKDTFSKYPGVSYKNEKYRHKKWVAYINIDKKKKHLGYFLTEEEAHDAYLNALKEYGIENKYATQNQE